jgi:glycosyltransferase involved in cell wall biosynthesis
MTSILVVSEKYWPYGGAELATHLILRLLRDEGFTITVAIGMKRIDRLDDVRYVYFPVLDAPSKVHLWSRLLYPPQSLKKLIEFSEVVYIPRISYPIIPLAKRYGKKVIVHLHNYQPINFESVNLYPYEANSEYNLIKDLKNSLMLEMLEYGDLKRALASSVLTPINMLCRFWLAEADAIVCVSRKQGSIISRKLPELASKIRVIYNPPPEVPLVEKKLSDPPSMLYMGGEMYTKGFHTFLRASMKLLHIEGDVKFMVTGNIGDKWKKLFDILNRRISNSYKVLGYVLRESLLRLHSESYALLFPSIGEEPLPYAVLESMLAGTIPITSRVGGVPEIVQGTYAERMLFKPGSVDELVDRMKTVLSLSHEELIDIGASLRESTLKKFNVSIIKNQLLNVFGLE